VLVQRNGAIVDAVLCSKGDALKWLIWSHRDQDEAKLSVTATDSPKRMPF
jgi:predicted mannosyl-3-phosphoglycerate phosphatase (HAD superfamily)